MQLNVSSNTMEKAKRQGGVGKEEYIYKAQRNTN
jgi:hypothetical protein